MQNKNAGRFAFSALCFVLMACPQSNAHIYAGPPDAGAQGQDTGHLDTGHLDAGQPDLNGNDAASLDHVQNDLAHQDVLHWDSQSDDARQTDAGEQDHNNVSDAAVGNDTASSDSGENTLSQSYPGDEGLATDPAVLFFDDFENGWGRWTSPDHDTSHLFIENNSGTAHAGSHYLRSTVTVAQLQENQYISASPYISFAERVPDVYVRFYARFPAIAPNPHHWIRFSAGDDSYWSSGLANTVPPGDQGFWFDFDINNDDIFNFYVYWYKMRSGRCNDGTAVPGCEGDQGSTYYYGNSFQPLNQSPYPRDQWFCIEIGAHANPVGESTGSLRFWINDQPVGAFGPGYPEGTWLRDKFNVGGCNWSACTEPVPFEGFDFRSDSNVLFKRFFLDAYYQRDTNENKRQVLRDRGLTPVDEQTIYYDDLVIATQRIGCRRP